MMKKSLFCGIGLALLQVASAYQIDKNAVVPLTVGGDATARHAGDELARLLKRAGVKVEQKVSEGTADFVALGAASTPDLGSIRDDGFVRTSTADGVTVASTSGKGVLNGVYELAETLGYAFLLPGESGERVPAELKAVPDGQKTVNPRFPRRGIFASSRCVGYTVEEWYAFLAKLRFNSICAHSDRSVPERMDLLRLLGFRAESGGHGMSSCVPRQLFETEPELFRMFQPEDFGGKRMKDSNFCVTNPKTRDLVKENFKKRLETPIKEGVHAIHAWADDLPGGGWCMCSRCRALAGTDQSALTMNVEAAAIRELGVNMRVPVIAYHDTMFPSTMFAPDPLCFLLFAPRERCYAHAINDASCARNRIYMRALTEYMKRFAGVDDAHTFEYYNDKILYRGHTPFLPDVLLGDATAYEQAGITCWMSLQVGGDLQAIDWNMLTQAMASWDASLTRATLIKRLAAAAGGADAAAWQRYLEANASAYAAAWQICDMPYEIYLDYRFMPERGGAEGAALVDNLTVGAARLGAGTTRFAAEGLADALSSEMARKEIARATFETLDLEAMVAHQRGLKNIAEYLTHFDEAAREQAVADLTDAVACLERADKAYAKLCVPDHKQYYPGFIKNWTVPEIKNKIRIYSKK